MKKYNFNAGPSILPREVIENTAKQCLDFNGSGLSLMEISHRAKDFQPVVDEAVALVKELLQIPEGYSVIFLGGGASLEFCMIPYNFLIRLMPTIPSSPRTGAFPLTQTICTSLPITPSMVRRSARTSTCPFV